MTLTDAFNFLMWDLSYSPTSSDHPEQHSTSYGYRYWCRYWIQTRMPTGRYYTGIYGTGLKTVVFPLVAVSQSKQSWYLASPAIWWCCWLILKCRFDKVLLTLILNNFNRQPQHLHLGVGQSLQAPHPPIKNKSPRIRPGATSLFIRCQGCSYFGFLISDLWVPWGPRMAFLSS